MKSFLPFAFFTACLFAAKTTVLAQTAPPVIWDKTYGGSDAEQLISLQQTSDGGYILGGFSLSGISGDRTQASKGLKDYWIVRLDINGNKIWDKSFGGSGNDHLFAVKQTSDGGYILGGRSNSGISGDKTQPSKGLEDFWVIKLDASGNKTWDKSFGGNGTDELYALQQTTDGGYILGGISDSGISGDKSQPTQGNIDFWVVKLDANGNKTWDKTIGGSGFDALYDLQQTSDGGYILGGGSESGISGDKSQISQGNSDFWVVKLDANGNNTWDKTFGGSDDDRIFALQQTVDGGYILGGNSRSNSNGDKSQPSKGDNDYWIIKLNAGGNKIWDKTIGGSSDDQLFSLQQTSDLGFILGGFSLSGISGDKTQASNGLSDYWIVKLDGTGNKIWDKSLGGNGNNISVTLQQTSDGGYILGGFSNSGISGNKTQTSRGDFDFWVVKLGGSLTGLNEIEMNPAVSIYPNPNQGRFTLELTSLNTSTVTLSVSDMLGRMIIKEELEVINGKISRKLTMPLVKGIYSLQLKTSEKIISKRIVIE